MMGITTWYIQGINTMVAQQLICRFVHAGVRLDQWPKYIHQAFRILKPGIGRAQFTEAMGAPMFEHGIEPEDSVIPEVLSNT
jgi:hypothetical protein